MKVLVTGGQGFIGQAVVKNLLGKGHEVTVFDRFDQGHTPFLKQLAELHETQIHWFCGDVTRSHSVRESVSRHDGVINLAAILGTAETVTEPHTSVDVNIHGALNVFEACRDYGVKAVQIATGSRGWYNTYAISKRAADTFALMFNQEMGTQIAVVEAVNIYGPYQKLRPVRKAVPNFIYRAIKEMPLEIFGTGNQILDLLYIDDCAEILVRALTEDHGVYDERIQAGTGKAVTCKELAILVLKLCDLWPGEITYLPRRAGEPVNSVTKADPKLVEKLGYSPEEFTPLREGLKATIEWYREQGEIDPTHWG